MQIQDISSFEFIQSIQIETNLLANYCFIARFLNMENKLIAMLILGLALSQGCFSKQMRFIRDVEEIASTTSKDTTVALVSGNTNRLVNLIRLPLRFKVLAHILDDINESLTDSPGKFDLHRGKQFFFFWSFCNFSLTCFEFKDHHQHANSIRGNDNPVTTDMDNLAVNVNVTNATVPDTIQSQLIGDISTSLTAEIARVAGEAIVNTDDLLKEVTEPLEALLTDELQDGVSTNNSVNIGNFTGALVAQDALIPNTRTNDPNLVGNILNGIVGSVDQFIDNLTNILGNLNGGVVKDLADSDLVQQDIVVPCQPVTTDVAALGKFFFFEIAS